MTTLKTRFPAILSCFAFALGFAAIIIITTKRIGHWYYPLDDTYIEMSIAKHLALNGVWGTSSQFASAASSPGFILLLAICYKLTGASQYAPLALAFASCFGVIFVCANRLRAPGVLLLVALTPLWTMATLGMEHALHILLCLLFLDLAASMIAFNQQLNWKIMGTAFLMVSIRYESLFVIAGACLLLLLRKRWQSCIALACAGWFPVFIFGLYFRLHGARWLPNSILLKSGAVTFHIAEFFARGYYIVPMMFLATWLAWTRRWSLTNSYATCCLGITTITLWLHFLFADYGWCYRYEAYLVALGIVSLVMCYREAMFSNAQVYLSAIALGFLMTRAIAATVNLPSFSRDIYLQQVQTAKFLSTYPGPAALNDIGAPTYFTDAPILDLVGLGSQDVFRARYHHPYTTEALSRLLAAHDIHTIAVYDAWFSIHPAVRFGGPPLPSNYVRVGSLITPNSGNLGSNTVSFYATQSSVNHLRSALLAFRPSLPLGDRLEIR